MDESKEASAESSNSGLLTLAEVPSWVTHDAANDKRQEVSCSSLPCMCALLCILPMYLAKCLCGCFTC